MVMASSPDGTRRPASPTRGNEQQPPASSKGELAINWIMLAVSGGAIAAAFSGLFGAPERAQIVVSIGVAIILPFARWLYGGHQGRQHGSQ